MKNRIKTQSTLDQVTKLHENKTSYTTAIAYAVIEDNGLWNDMSDEEKALFCNMADNITYIMHHSDEPRFTLYDYLDAIVNHAKLTWVGIARKLREILNGKSDDDIQDAMNRLAYMAGEKRRVYGS